MFDRFESLVIARYSPMARTRPEKVKTKPARPRSDLDRAQRLIDLRKAFSYEQQAAFAIFLGVSKQRYGFAERGGPLGIEMAQMIVRKLPGVTLDYLYNGKPDGLSLELARRLGLLTPPGK